jgi:hypothetical protein
MADVIHLLGTVNNDGSSIGHVNMLGTSQVIRPDNSPPEATQLAELTQQSGVLEGMFDEPRYYTGDATT